MTEDTVRCPVPTTKYQRNYYFQIYAAAVEGGIEREGQLDDHLRGVEPDGENACIGFAADVARDGAAVGWFVHKDLNTDLENLKAVECGEMVR